MKRSFLFDTDGVSNTGGDQTANTAAGQQETQKASAGADQSEAETKAKEDQPTSQDGE